MKNKYKDANNRLFKIGDIVYNPCFGDFWVVQKCNKQDKLLYDLDNKYCLALYNNKDLYVIEIDVPTGFEIILRKGDKGYRSVLSKINEFAERRLCNEQLEKTDK